MSKRRWPCVCCGMLAMHDTEILSAFYGHTSVDVHRVRRSFPKLETTLDWVLQLYWVILPALVRLCCCGCQC